MNSRHIGNLKLAALCLCVPGGIVLGAHLAHRVAHHLAAPVHRPAQVSCLPLAPLGTAPVDVLHGAEFTPPTGSWVTGGAAAGPTEPAPEPPPWALFVAALAAFAVFRVRP